MKLSELSDRLINRKCKISFNKAVPDCLLEKSKKVHGKNASVFDRLISREIEPCISDALLSLDKEFYTITIGVKAGEFVFTKRKSKDPNAKKEVAKKAAKKVAKKKTTKKVAKKTKGKK